MPFVFDDRDDLYGFTFDNRDDLYGFTFDNKDDISHYGTKRHSGRYPWGSGKEPYQHSSDFLSRIDEYKALGLSEKQIADAFGLTLEKYRTQRRNARDDNKLEQYHQAMKLKADGIVGREAARQMGIPEATYRSLMKEDTIRKAQAARATADFIKEQIETKGMIDVGKGVNRELGITETKMKEALSLLEQEGYPIYAGRFNQVTNPDGKTTQTVICPKGTEHKDIFDLNSVHSLQEYASIDGGDTFSKFQYPASMDSKRLAIRYREDGGINKDGVIELRPGVPDLSLGNSHYAQVRILVDGNRYLKGMAVYGDPSKMPDGVDVIFNTNKSKDVPKMDVLKATDKNLAKDPNNPFGSLIKRNGQSMYDDPVTGEKKLSLINKKSDEGDWDEWNKALPSQFLAKQNYKLIDQQLKISLADKKAELDEIRSLTNNTLKKKLLVDYAEGCDSDAVHLQAAAMPRQRYQVILPMTTAKDNEIYAPNYKNGETVYLVRFPHAGTYEIPMLTVNNKLKEGNDVITKLGKDAVGITSKVAEQLSGADFDGDTVLVIPASGTKVSHRPALEQLNNFDPKMQYPERPGMTYMTKANTQKQMGMVSNLITDMTIKGASDDELARAVKHSMVVIDAEKHKLDWKRSEEENGIKELKDVWQGHIAKDGHYSTGASTLISRAKAEETVRKRVGQRHIDPETGKWVQKEDTEEWTVTKTNKRTGEVTTTTKYRTQKSTQMAETDDALTLSSGTKQESLYGNYANRLKAMANEARKESLATPESRLSRSAEKAYATEVRSLDGKINAALLNAPRERQAQRIANVTIDARKAANPDITKKEIKKISQVELENARIAVGAKRHPIEVTDREWEAIQAGAVGSTKLKIILKYADEDKIRDRATPKNNGEISESKKQLIKLLAASSGKNGATIEEIAKRVGVSTSTVKQYM